MGRDRDQEKQHDSFSFLTLDSLFDIKGPVRLIPQGASQKPHIVLRREQSSQNAGESSCLPGTTRFSLVANKRFTISKGHTLSLGIADPSHHELKLLNSESSFLLEFDFSDQLHIVDDLSSLPARLRKTMSGTKTYDAFTEARRPISLGFPGYPFSVPQTRVFASASVQTDPVEIPVSSPTPTPSLTSLKAYKQDSPLRLYPSPISADDHEDPPVDISAQSREDDSDTHCAPTERSLSAMVLSTPSQSPRNSPVNNLAQPESDNSLIPGPMGDDFFSISGAPEVETAQEVSETCGVSACAEAVEPNEIKMPQAEKESCCVVLADATTSRLKPKESSQLMTNGPLVLPQLYDKPTKPREMFQQGGISKVLQRIPSTPFPQPTISNPLGIQPSANLLSKPPPKGPRSLVGSAIPATVQTPAVEPTEVLTPVLASTAQRKPVVVGAKWTALRGSSTSLLQGNGNSNATFATAPGSPSSPVITCLRPRTIPIPTPATKTTTSDLSQILRYSSASPPHGETMSNVPSSSTKRVSDVENDILNGQRSLKRVRGEGQTRVGQPKKKARIENVEVDSLPSASAGLCRTTRSPEISPVDSKSGGGDSAEIVSKNRTRRRRERQKSSRKRKAQEQGNREAVEVKETPKSEEEERSMKKDEGVKTEREENEKIENAFSLTQEKVEVDNQKLATSTATVPAQKVPTRIVHPLPPRPRTVIGGPISRSGRETERRGRTSSPNRSRSHSRGKDLTEGSSRKRHLSVDRKRLEKETKPSPASNSGDVGGAQIKEDEHTSNEAPVSRTTLVRAQSRTVAVSDNAMWPHTNPSDEFQLLGTQGACVAVRQLVFSSDGKRLAIVCDDMTVQIWETTSQTRGIITLQADIVAACWVKYDAGLLVLCSDGSTHIWTQARVWQRETLFYVPLTRSDKPHTLAYGKDRIAISTNLSVKIWMLTPKGRPGVWQTQREIKRSGVTALLFQTDGSGLFGGCRDGTLWYCEVPNGTLKAYAFLPSNKCITSIQLHPSGTQLLVGQKGGTAYLISHQPIEKKGTLETEYNAKTDDETEGTFTAIFATRGQAVVNGIKNGCAIVWDRKNGNMVYGLKHGNDDTILAIAASDGLPGVNGMMVSGTRKGKVCWWPIPKAPIR